jgi:hypothetical protein
MVVVVDTDWDTEAGCLSAYPPSYTVTAEEIVWKPLHGRRKRKAAD